MILPLARLASAGEHDAPAVGRVVAGAPEVPAGPPVDRRVTVQESLQDAILRSPAGSTLTLASGRHAGPVVVDRPLVLRGEAGAVVDGGGAGTVVTIAAPDVVVRDLTVTGGGHLPQNDDSGLVVGGDRALVERVHVTEAYLGIDLRMASDSVVRDCVVDGRGALAFGLRGDGIRLWESDRNRIEGNELRHVRDLVVWYSDDNLIARNLVTGSRYGTHLMHTEGNRIEENVYDQDVVGVFVMYSDTITLRSNTVTGAHGEAGMGFGFKESDGVVCEDNVLADDTTGVYLDTTPHRLGSEVRFSGNLFAANDVGVRFHGPSAGARFEGNAFVANVVPGASDERGRSTNAEFRGNHWSGYGGYDLDGDGVGDLPYEVRSASGRLRERNPSLAWWSGTPALALVDLFVAAFPMFAPDPVLTDTAPLLHPPEGR